MRVLQIARYGSIVGGAETYVAALGEGLRAAGYHVSLLYGLDPDTSRPEVAEGAQLGCLVEPATAPGPGDAATLRAAVDAMEPDIVHVHVPDIAWIAPFLALSRPTLLAVHDHRVSCPTSTRYWRRRDAHCDVQPGLKCFFHNVVSGCGSLKANITMKPYSLWAGARSAARAVPVQVFSGFMRDQVASVGLLREDVHVLPYPVPPSPAAASIDDDDARPVIFASGRLNHEKGFTQLLDALPAIEPAVHLVIAGEGYLADALRAHAVPPRHRVSYLGWVDAAVAAGWRARSAVVVVPSVWPEPFGIVGIEAMAAGKPVVAFAGGGIGEWLVDGVTGVEVPGHDVRALGTAVGALVDDPARSRELGAAGEARAAERFGLAEHVERLTALYQRSIDLWAPRSGTASPRGPRR